MMPLFLQAEAVPRSHDVAGFVQGYWPILVVCLLGMAAVYLLLPRPRRYPLPAGIALGLLAIVLAGCWLMHAEQKVAEAILFYSFAGLAVIGGGVMIAQTHPVQAALAFALVVLSTCGLFLLQAAPFLMVTTIIIYAGAIIVTFLFVIMLAQQSGQSNADHRSREPLLASVAGFVLLGALLCVLSRSYEVQPHQAMIDKLQTLLERVDRARQASSFAKLKVELGKSSNLFGVIREEAQEIKSKAQESRQERQKQTQDVQKIDLRAETAGPAAAALEAACDEADAAVAKDDDAEVRQKLADVDGNGRRLAIALQGILQPDPKLPLSPFSGLPPNQIPAKDRTGRVHMPAHNVTAIGRSLFTDYLVAVELAAALLMVATIGAIAIAGRRTEGLR